MSFPNYSDDRCLDLNVEKVGLPSVLVVMAAVAHIVSCLVFRCRVHFICSFGPPLMQLLLLNFHGRACVKILVFLTSQHRLLHDVQEHLPLSVKLDRCFTPQGLFLDLA